MAESVFKGQENWTGFYGEVKEELPSRMSNPRAIEVCIYILVDENQSENFVI